MQKVCDVLEKLLACGVIQKYAIGGATAAGFHGEPLATRDIDVFCYLDLPDGCRDLLPLKDGLDISGNGCLG